MFEGVLGAVILSLIAFTTVFLILIILSLVMFSFKFLFAKEGHKRKKEIPQVITSKEESFIPEEESEEEIAAVMSAIYAYLGSSSSSFRINFVREISPDSHLWKHSNKLLRRR